MSSAEAGTEAGTEAEAEAEAATGIPPGIAAAREALTPMLSQYAELCTAHESALVLFQVGDFYEAFCEAAAVVARVCEVTLTERTDSTGAYPMAGIPIDNAATYLEALLDAGYRVALGDQVEDAADASGLVDRAVTTVITPGTVVDDELLESGTTNYVAAVASGDDEESTLGLAAVDVATGECLVTAGSPTAITDELARLTPTELLVGPDVAGGEDTAATTSAVDGFNPVAGGPERAVHRYEPAAFDRQTALDRLAPYDSAPTRRFEHDGEIRAAGAVLAYAEYTQGDAGPLAYVSRIQRYDVRDRLRLDAAAQQSLELFENRGLGASDTVFDVLDETSCALGRRCLRRWLKRPLVDVDTIRSRHDAVSELTERTLTREAIADALATAADLERLAGRIARERADARDLRSLHATLAVVPALKATLAGGEGEAATASGGASDGASDEADGAQTTHLRELSERLTELTEIKTLIDEAIVTDPPQDITDGGVIRDGFDETLDAVRATARAGRDWIADLEQRERERTGIESLTVGHTQVHGYYIEVTDANVERVPEEYRRRQTLKNSERYYTPALQEREAEILDATARADAIEYERFTEVRSQVKEATTQIQALAEVLAELDALASLASVAVAGEYVRPTMVDEPTAGVDIEGGRHPVVERAVDGFVPNDADVPRGAVVVITGPNMSGKSTYMRQVALTVVLAQIGSFVPAQAARLPVLSRIFTRVGASDDIAGGESTFMREMSELTAILHDAGPDALVLLDEVGRGTATTDGRAIARAAAEFIHDELEATTLFATHYHDLTDLAAERERAFNRHFTATRENGEVTFLHRVVPGASSSSYGVEVAELAGVPRPVVERSRTLVGAATGDGADATGAAEGSSSDGEGGSQDRTGQGRGDRGRGREPDPDRTDQNRTDQNQNHRASTDPTPAEAVATALDTLDLARTTPIEALNVIHDLKQQLDDAD